MWLVDGIKSEKSIGKKKIIIIKNKKKTYLPIKHYQIILGYTNVQYIMFFKFTRVLIYEHDLYIYSFV